MLLLGAGLITGVAAPAQAATGSIQRLSAQASVLTGSSQIESADPSNSRELAVSRDSQREALEDAAEEELQAAAEAQAQEMLRELKVLGRATPLAVSG